MNEDDYVKAEGIHNFVDESLDINTITLYMLSNDYDCVASQDNIAVYSQDGRNGGITVHLEDDTVKMVISRFNKPINCNSPDGLVRRLISISEVKGGKGLSISGDISNLTKIALIKYFALATDSDGTYDNKNFDNIKSKYVKYFHNLIL